MVSLLEKLGRAADSRLVILVSDGLGSSNAANQAVAESLRHGLATSAAVQVPCPWASGAAANHRGEDVGVSLTFNAPFDVYRWGPITQAPSLLGGNGGFPATVADLWDHADPHELRREARAQIERAILWGFDPSFLDAHLHAISSRPEFFDVYLELAIDFQLPITLPDPSVELGFPARELAAAEGVLCADRAVSTNASDKPLAALSQALVNAEPGVTEIHLAPAFDTEEIRSLDPSWPRRVSDAHAMISDLVFKAQIERSDVELIGFTALRTAQRKDER